MAEINQLILLAEYNQLMNERQYAAAVNLSKDELGEDKGTFFKSVLGTLNHILVGDIIWLKRFAEHPSSIKSLSYIREMDKPSKLSSILFTELDGLKEEREKIDEVILNWIRSLSEDDLNRCISYKNMAGSSFSKSFVSLIHHLFLHQVHHRGQVTTLLSQYGVEFGETDLIEIINECITQQGAPPDL
ncbi:MAG: DinB family protein [Sedimenticola sp.]